MSGILTYTKTGVKMERSENPKRAGFCSVIENTPEVECSDEFDLILIIYMTLYMCTENKVSCSIEKMIVANLYDNRTHIPDLYTCTHRYHKVPGVHVQTCKINK